MGAGSASGTGRAGASGPPGAGAAWDPPDDGASMTTTDARGQAFYGIAPLEKARDQAPRDWRARYRLALAYDASGDRRRAREAAREAVRLHRAG